MVLGRSTRQDQRGRHLEHKSYRHESGPYHHPWRCYCHHHVGGRNDAFLWIAGLLPASPRLRAWVRFRHFQAQDRDLVFHDGGTSFFFIVLRKTLK